MSVFSQESYPRDVHKRLSRASCFCFVCDPLLFFLSSRCVLLAGAALKGRVQVTFVNQHGVEEAGIDGGGVFKEYMDLLTKRAFDPQYALFLATEDQVRRHDTLNP